jgi:polyphosphate kinase
VKTTEGRVARNTFAMLHNRDKTRSAGAVVFALREAKMPNRRSSPEGVLEKAGSSESAEKESPLEPEGVPDVSVPVEDPGPNPVLDDPSLYVNREISWLAFNQRVLDEAGSVRWPLLERLKFLAIFSSNLDEFFMIRVSGLHEQLEAAVAETSPDGLSPREQLDRIAGILRAQLQIAADLLANDLAPALAAQGIHIRDWESLEPERKRLGRQYFRKSVFPVLTPLGVDPGHPFPFLSNLSLSLAVETRDPETEERKFARVKVPESLPRFVPVSCFDGDGTGGHAGPHDGKAHEARFHDHKGHDGKMHDGKGQNYVPLEQVIAAHLEDLFPGMEILGCYPFRVTRDMDMAILEEEAHDLLSIVNREIRQRRFGACVRLEVSCGIPDRIRHLLLEKLEIDEEDVYESPVPLGMGALMSIATLNRPDLRDPPFLPRVPPELAEGEDPFAAIRDHDLLLHHPYDSFTPVLDFLRRAANDPQVLAIKMTLYRAGSTADAVRALVHAAENGKQVAVSIEIKARFDEENNIAWARTLERAGAHVFFGQAVSKTHAKVVLVVRQEAGGLQRYVHIATGNYNASTARLYTDIGLFTADPQIGEDVSELFNSLSGFSKKGRYRKIAVAPMGLANAILAKIDEQAKGARSGRPARIFAKLNSLVDVRVIQALYRASCAGVSIDLCVRGICCLRPGVPGVSENIRVFSIVGRFLEHERVFAFGSPGEEEIYLSSADWMPRNLYRRVEVMFPVESRSLRDRIREEVIEPALGDNVHAYQMKEDGSYARRQPADGAPARSAQLEVLERTARPAPHGSNGRRARKTNPRLGSAPGVNGTSRPHP